MPRLDELEASLMELQREGLLRESPPAQEVALRESGVILACTNDYLGLGAEHVSRETLDSPAGSGASRLIHGTHAEHVELEEALATWVRLPSALLFSSGYAANLGTLSALADRDCLIVSDSLNHASLIDGCRLSRARTEIARHLDVADVARRLRESPEAKARYVVVESYYSMDADSPDLPRLREICDELDAFLVVDEAHALGVFGPDGGGLCAQHHVRPDVLIGTLGKALGASGAFAAGSHTLRTWLWNRARSFVFSTAPSPLLARHTLRNLRRIQRGSRLRQRLEHNSARLRQLLAETGVLPLATSHGPIIPVLLGDNFDVLDTARRLARQGVLVQAIRPPTVPAGTARLRLTVSAAHSDEQLRTIADAVGRSLET